LDTLTGMVTFYDDDLIADLVTDVINALRRLLVDEIEDDGSGWDESYASSEPMEDFAELTMQAMKEANGMDTT
jgi:hypothetical protein